MTALGDLLGRLEPEKVRRGRQFARICQWFLTHDPVYAHELRRVWLWDDWRGRWGADAGIDLVAEDVARYRELIAEDVARYRELIAGRKAREEAGERDGWAPDGYKWRKWNHLKEEKRRADVEARGRVEVADLYA